MKSIWKILFWICLVLLLATNISWLYHTIDVAVGHGYYQVSCNEYQKDILSLKQILYTKKSKKEALEFLDAYKIDHEGFQKGEDFIISLSSFQLIYGPDGRLKPSENYPDL
ncbi:MAG: hypothetical protein ACNS60_13570 [Candidatus Cyclobacteriaceae bacterium M2_1C_046]